MLGRSLERHERVCSPLLVALLTFAVFSMSIPVYASSGNILVDTQVAPSGIIEVEIGGSVNLYFGGVTWSGGTIDLYISPNGYAALNYTTDTKYGPTFSVPELMSTTIDTTTYENYSIGNNWINGTISTTLEIPAGNYYIKAFDGTTSAVAVTDNYIKIKAAFEVVPSYGPGQAGIELKGYALPANDYANLSYNDGSGWKTIVNLYPAGGKGRFAYAMPAPDLARVLPAGLQPETYSTITFRLIVNGTGQILTDTYDEYQRGLKQVYSPDSVNVTVPSGWLFGNETDFVFYGLYVKVKGNLAITGKWFNPGAVTILWDGTTAIGTATADENGFFKATVTVPVTSEGLHNVLIRDAKARFILKVHCLAFVDSIAPIANAGPDQTVNQDTMVTLDGSGSTDNVGIVSYVWTFTDVTKRTLTGVNPTYNFTTPGICVITLNVTDAAGNWDIDRVVITVLDVTAPVAEAGPDQTVNEDTLVTLDGSNSADNVGIVSYVWTFVDVVTRTFTGAKVTYAFSRPGVYTVTLNVTDAAGNWRTDTVVITVLDVTPPIAKAGLNQTVVEDTVVYFDASGSSDNVGIVSYEWDFGDGTNETGLTADHNYTRPGNCTVTLRVRDAANNSNTDSIVITVLARLSNVQESPNNYFPLVNLAILSIAVVAVIGAALVVCFAKVKSPVSKEEFVKREISEFDLQSSDIKNMNPDYYEWKVTMIRHEAEKQFDQLRQRGYLLVDEIELRKRLAKELRRKAK